jgi:hypothetical protein
VKKVKEYWGAEFSFIRELRRVGCDLSGRTTETSVPVVGILARN